MVGRLGWSLTKQAVQENKLQEVANCIRMLAVDAVEAANSGHPGMPMGMAEIASVLWLKHLQHNPQVPDWLGRDRVVISNGHGSMLLYAALHLSGYDLSLDELKNFRQLGSKTPGHPESFVTPGVEATTGPLGQGIANAVGMAIASKHYKERYGGAEELLGGNQVYCLLGDGCLMEGISSEACSLAGHLGLGNLIAIYDDNEISIAGSTNLAFSEQVPKRFESQGWHVISIDGHSLEEIDKAISEAKSETSRPSLILAKTQIGFGSPNKVNTAGAHGAPLGGDEVSLTRENLGWPEEKFFVSDTVRSTFKSRQEDLLETYSEWKEGFSSWSKSNSEASDELSLRFSGEFSANLGEELLASLPADVFSYETRDIEKGSEAANSGKKQATRQLSSVILQKAAGLMPGLMSGSADLEPSTKTYINRSSAINAEDFSGQNIHFGVREHAMGAILNGLSYYGGFSPLGSTFLVFADYMRPAIRMAALAKLPTVFVFTHDSIMVGEDGPTHQPIEQINSLRMIPNLYVARPADGLETAMCYEMAFRRRTGPTALCLTRQGVPPLSRPEGFDPQSVLLGAYCLWQNFSEGEKPELVFVATGSETSLALEVAKQEVFSSLTTRVVSMPCWERFMECSAEYKNELIPRDSKLVVIEAGLSFGWSGMLNADPDSTLVVGVDHFGESAPGNVLKEKYGLTPESVTERIAGFLGS